MMSLVTRGDDAGSCVSANEASIEAARGGVLRNLSILVPGPAFESLVPHLKNLEGVDLGLHVCLNAEWDHVKWGPVLGAERAPTLVDEQGHFTPAPGALHQKGFDLEEAAAEIEAQYARMRDAGLDVAYIDTHMMVDWVPGIGSAVAALREREGLRNGNAVPFLEGAETRNPADLLAAVARAEGVRCWLTHPGKDAPDMRAFGHSGLAEGQVARERAAELEFLTHPELLAAVAEGRLRPLRFREALA